jgi:hypothetical protein
MHALPGLRTSQRLIYRFIKLFSVRLCITTQVLDQATITAEYEPVDRIVPVPDMK